MANQTTPQPNSSEDIRDLLSLYLDGEVTAEEKQRVEQALAEDAALRRELDTLSQTVTLLSAMPQMPAPRPFTLSEADVAETQKRRNPPEEKESWLRWFPFNVGWLAAALAMVFIAFSFWQAADRVAQEQQELASAPTAAVQQEEAARIPATPEVAAAEAIEAEEQEEAEAQAIEEAPLADDDLALQEAEEAVEESAEESVENFAAEAVEEEAAEVAPVEEQAAGDAPPPEADVEMAAGAAESAPAEDSPALREAATPAPQLEITEEPTPQPIPPAETAAPIEGEEAAAAQVAPTPTPLAATIEATALVPSPTTAVTAISSPTIAAIIEQRDDTTAELISYIWLGWIGLIVLAGLVWWLTHWLRRKA